MSIHAKTLNQLATEFEGPDRAALPYIASQQLSELPKTCDANWAAANELVSPHRVPQLTNMGASVQTNSAIQREVRPFFVDSTPGTRYLTAELVTMSESEVSIPLYSRFTSTSGIFEITKKGS